VNIQRTKILTSSQKQDLFELWNKEYPRDLKYENIKDFEDYLKPLKDLNSILLLDENEKIKGWYFDFLRENERWFAVILDSNIQGQNFGTQILNLSKVENTELNGWVIKSETYLKDNGEPYNSPIEFYRKNGFKILEETKLETDNISAIKVKWFKTGNNIG
jgi:GNAT superfamily N-acetyltransferase